METGRRTATSLAHRRRMARVRALIRQRDGREESTRRRRRRPRPRPPPAPRNARNGRAHFSWGAPRAGQSSAPPPPPPPPPDVPLSPVLEEPVPDPPDALNESHLPSPRRSSSGCGGFFSRLLRRSRKTRVAPARSSAPRESEEAWRGVCVICWEPYDKGVRRFRCRHKDFCRACITKWKEKGDTCPLCRACPRGVRLFKD